MSDARIAEIKAQQRARAKKYYDAHKAEIAERRKRQRGGDAAAPEAPAAAAPAPAEPAAPKKRRVIIRDKNSNKVLRSVPVLTEATCLEGLEKLNTTEGNRETNRGFIRTVFKMLGGGPEASINSMLKTATDFSAFIDSKRQVSGKSKKGLPYADNTKRNFVNAVLNTLKGYGYTENSPEFDIDGLWTEYKIYKSSKEFEKEKKKINTTTPVLAYDVFLKKVKTAFGEASPQYMFACMFNEVTLRSNYNDIKVVGRESDVVNNKTNYIVATTTGPCYIVLQSYKTASRYGTKRWDFSPETSALIRAYVIKNTIKKHEKLFQNLPKILTEISAAIKEKIGVNVLRHMVASTLFHDPSTTTRDIFFKTQVMGNSPRVFFSNYVYPLRRR